LLCSGSADSTLKVFDLKTKKFAVDLPGHADEVIAPSPYLYCVYFFKMFHISRFTLWIGALTVSGWQVEAKTKF
jgi:hypothetical protein